MGEHHHDLGRGAIGVHLRIEDGEERSAPYVDVDLGGRVASLTPAAASDRSLSFATPRTSTLVIDVVHDDDRDELVSVVAARLRTVLEREGADCYGWDLSAEPNVRENLRSRRHRVGRP